MIMSLTVFGLSNRVSDGLVSDTLLAEITLSYNQMKEKYF